MLDLTKFDSCPHLDDRERYLDAVQSAIIDGMRAALAVAGGRAPDVDTLINYAEGMDELRVGFAQGRLHFGWIQPTEDDVRNVRHLVQLVREGVPGVALIEPARRAARVVTDPWDLERFYSALLCLEKDAWR